MEQLAFVHAAIAYEDPAPAPELRSLDELTPKLSPAVLVSVASGVVAASILTAAPNAQAVVKYGDVCSAVSDVQGALQDEGYYSGSVDEIFGSGTESAVKRFQTASDLSADGIVGPATADALGLSNAGNADSPFLVGNSCGSSSDGGGGGLPAGTYYIDLSNGANIRRTPNGTIIGSKGNGASVTITSEQESAGGYNWAKLSDGSGWVATDFLSSSDSSDSGSGSDGLPAGTYYVDSSTGVNIRSAPNGTIVGSKGGGAAITITSQQESAGGYNWAKLSDGSGWIATEFLSSSNNNGGGGGAPGRAEVTAAALIVRSSPNGSDTGETLYRGDVVRVTGVTQTGGGVEWSELSSGDWVATDYLDLL